MENKIALSANEWFFDTDKPLGPPGGFGQVFHGRSADDLPVAVKQLKLEVGEAAHRELRIANLLSENDYDHIIPFLDAGQDAESDRYYVVMPIAEESLLDHIETNGSLSEIDAILILKSIASGLVEVGDIVHRDLKPGNILFHKSKWCISDFGIARFVEESTSLNTLKDCLSPPFASPEQWKLETITHASDIYSLGCIGYCLLTGQPPFWGGTTDEYREQHLNTSPPVLSNCSPKLRSVLTKMLRKSPEVRPSLDRVIKVLDSIDGDKQNDKESSALSSLEEAVASAEEEKAIVEAKAETARAEGERKKIITNDAKEIFLDIRDKLFEAILDTVGPDATKRKSELQYSNAVLIMFFEGPEGGFPVNPFLQSKWDVLLSGYIEVRQLDPRYIWSSSLFYMKKSPDDDYRWWEVSFHGITQSARQRFEPHKLDDLGAADEAVSVVMGIYQIAFGPVCIDDEDFDDFSERWIELFAKAVKHELKHPGRMPLV